MRPIERVALLVAVGWLGSGTAHGDELAPEADGAVTVELQHSFSRAEARVRIQQLLDYWNERWGVHRDWDGDTARVQGMVMGIPFNARLVVRDHEVLAIASDPGFLMRHMALDYVSRKLRKYLHPSYDEG
jgi:hypothetical protein